MTNILLKRNICGRFDWRIWTNYRKIIR